MATTLRASQVLARPSQVGVVRAGCLYPVGGDADPVEVHVRQARLLGGAGGLLQVRSMSGEHVDSLVQVSVDGFGADGGVGGALG